MAGPDSDFRQAEPDMPLSLASMFNKCPLINEGTKPALEGYEIQWQSFLMLGVVDSRVSTPKAIHSHSRIHTASYTAPD